MPASGDCAISPRDAAAALDEANVILGVLSDTHGRAERAARAVGVLKRLGAEALVHCGDVGSDGVLDALAGVPSWFVWGNTDHDADELSRYALLLGLPLPGDAPLRLDLAGKRISVFHGHESACGRLFDYLLRGDAERFVRAADCDYLLHGHTHVAADQRVGGVRLLNPGALHRARAYSVATIDLVQDRVEHWIVPDEEESQFPKRMRVTAEAD